MKLEEAPNILKNKFYNKYTGKTLDQYEWTRLKNLILNLVAYLDKNFKNEIRKGLRRGKIKLSSN